MAALVRLLFFPVSLNRSSILTVTRGCATKFQITGLKDTTENDAAKAPGYDRLSAESQEQVRLAFEEGRPVDKEFKGVCAELAKVAPRYSKEYRDAEGYVVLLGDLDDDG